VEALFLQQDRRRRRRRRGGVNPMAFRLALGDPSRLLAPFTRFVPALFSGWACAVWLLAVVGAAGAAALHWHELRPYGEMVLRSPGYILTGWLMYPFIKAVHEAAHALAIQHYGMQARQAGLTLIMLNPVPFIDASAAESLRDRYQRAVVSAAGIMAELFIASCAMLVWLAVQPGTLRDLAFIAMLIGGLSTLLTNGNPLLRYDGYYLLCDLLDLRNLATRSGRYWADGAARVLFGIRQPVPLAPLPGERFWLVVYAPLSWVYRFGLSIAVGLWLGGFSALLGLLTGTLMLGANVGLPLWRMGAALLRAGADEANRRHMALRASVVCAALVGLVFFLPLPFRTQAEGVVWLPEQAQVRAETDGFVVALKARDGQRVAAGELIAVLEDQILFAQRASLASDVTETDVRLFRAIDKAPEEAPDLRERLAYSQAELARVNEKLRQREVRAPTAGVLVLPREEELVGQFKKRGQRIAYLLTDAPTVVRVALPQQDADLVRQRVGTGADGVEVRLADTLTVVHAAHVSHTVPGAVAKLPSAALGDYAGGRIATDPADRDGLTPRRPVVVVDVELPLSAGARFGARAFVRFDHGREPIAAQGLRSLRQLLLGNFNPAG
jgi:putative peptide zinc metalloprotease protein